MSLLDASDSRKHTDALLSIVHSFPQRSSAESSLPDEEVAQLSSAISASSRHFAALHSINRKAFLKVKGAKEEVATARNELDDRQLMLQNLEYERGQLEGEIQRCREFRSIYQDVTIHPLEDFLALAPEELRTPEIQANPHELMLSRLKFELIERKRLEAERQALQSQRTALAKESGEKRKKLEVLEGRLKEVLGNTEKVKAALDAF